MLPIFLLTYLFIYTPPVTFFFTFYQQITNWSPDANNTNSTEFFPSYTTVEQGFMKFITNENKETMINLPNHLKEPSMQYLDEITNEDITTVSDKINK